MGASVVSSLIGAVVSTVLGGILSDNQPQVSFTPTPGVTPPTPMPAQPKDTQKAIERQQAIGMAG